MLWTLICLILSCGVCSIFTATVTEVVDDRQVASAKRKSDFNVKRNQSEKGNQTHHVTEYQRSCRIFCFCICLSSRGHKAFSSGKVSALQKQYDSKQNYFRKSVDGKPLNTSVKKTCDLRVPHGSQQHRKVYSCRSSNREPPSHENRMQRSLTSGWAMESHNTTRDKPIELSEEESHVFDMRRVHHVLAATVYRLLLSYWGRTHQIVF